MKFVNNCISAKVGPNMLFAQKRKEVESVAVRNDEKRTWKQKTVIGVQLKFRK